MIYTGQLNKIINVLSPKWGEDDFGGTPVSWEKAATGIHASVQQGKGGFSVSNGEAVYTMGVTFQMRWNNAVTEYCRIEWEGRLYRIIRIERHREWNELKVDAELIT